MSQLDKAVTWHLCMSCRTKPPKCTEPSVKDLVEMQSRTLIAALLLFNLVSTLWLHHVSFEHNLYTVRLDQTNTRSAEGVLYEREAVYEHILKEKQRISKVRWVLAVLRFCLNELILFCSGTEEVFSSTGTINI